MMYSSHKIWRILGTRTCIPNITISCRQIRSQPSCQPAKRFGPGATTGTTSGSGMRVNAISRKTPVEVCTVHFLAGSRYEIGPQIGATHFLRSLAGASGFSSTKYAKMRHLQQMGAQLTCTSDRQTISYTLCCKPGDFKVLGKYLLDAATRCHYHDWDIDDVRNHVEDDLARIIPQQRVMDLVQTAALKYGPSHSVFCPRHQITEINSKILRSFVAQNFTTSKCSISAIGIKYDHVLGFVETLNLRKNPSPPMPPISFKQGYEAYDLGHGSETWIALTVPGTNSTDVKCLLTFWVLAAACGVRNVAGCFTHNIGYIDQKPLSTLAPNERVQFRAFNISYIDDGLFGILTRAPSELAAEVAFNAIDFLRRGIPNLTSDQLSIGKKRLMVDLMAYDEVALQSGPALAHGTACSVPVSDPREWARLVDGVSVDGVKEVAQYIANSVDDYLAVAVVGDLGTSPTDIELLSIR